MVGRGCGSERVKRCGNEREKGYKGWERKIAGTKDCASENLQERKGRRAKECVVMQVMRCALQARGVLGAAVKE